MHLPYSCSGTDRWKACPGSVELAEGLPERNDNPEYTNEGTAAHEAAEQAIRIWNKNTTKFEGSFNASQIPLVHSFSEDPELVEAAQDYVNEVFMVKLTNELLFEWVEQLQAHAEFPKFGGSADYACVYMVDDKVCLHVIDFKAGVGLAVDVIDNSQLLSYCAVIESNLPFDIDIFRMTIVQPRSYQSSESVKNWEVGPEAIIEHMLTVRAAFEQDTVVAGPHCRWCPVAPTCVLLSRSVIALSDTPISTGVTQSQVDRWLHLHSLGTTIRAVLDMVETRLIEAKRLGFDLRSHKVVETRSHRHWVGDQADTLKQLSKLGLPKRAVLVEPKIKSPAQIEKLLSEFMSKSEAAKAIAPAVDQTKTGQRVVALKAPGQAVLFGQEFPTFDQDLPNGQ